jgi:putative transposase
MKTNQVATGQIYHIFNKSIAGFEIFSSDFEFERMMKMMKYYQYKEYRHPFSHLLRISEVKKSGLQNYINSLSIMSEKLVQIIAYCFMPTHFHFALKQLADRGISTFINNLLNSYTRYFNKKINRKGPLWEGRFSKVLVRNDEQLLHLTRYIHLNPVTARLREKPEDWNASSYMEYLKKVNDDDAVCKFDELFSKDALANYKTFVEDRISYQRNLAKIKHLLID